MRSSLILLFLQLWGNVQVSVSQNDPLGCDSPPPLVDGDIKGSFRFQYSHGERVEYICQNLYEMSGDPFQTCENGKWLGTMRCLKVLCDKPDIQDADIIHNEKESYSDKEQVQFECKNGLEKRFTVTCEQGNWIEIQSCAAECQITGVPENVIITPNVQNNQLRSGQQLRFACRHPGHFLRGNAAVECLAHGQWSAPFPTCGDPLGCNNPPTLADGDIKESLQDHYSHNERVEYICQNFYQMEGEPYQTCINGEWFGKMRCLRPCTVDAEAMRRHNIAFKYRHADKLYAPHNDQIEFSCVRGKSSMRSRCIDGVMHLPTCF
ncbi:complement factor H-like isoform X1 [Sparus aurata]|uniref:complement factor H-like isoform X1 n=1 Tax=Sparus aurata TaxID=8175 RepID=UPI0011C1C9E2|nr:complement factor H-like isoform X1 [Sparus aurata]